MAAIIICSDFGAQKIKSYTVSTVSPSISHEVMGPDAMILIFCMLSFTQLLHFPLWLSSRVSLVLLLVSAIRMVSSAYLRLLIFLPAIFISASASSSPVFLMMYSAYKLKKQGGNIEHWHTPIHIWNQSFVRCPVLTVASLNAYRFLKRQVRWCSFRIFHSL